MTTQARRLVLWSLVYALVLGPLAPLLRHARADNGLKAIVYEQQQQHDFGGYPVRVPATAASTLDGMVLKFDGTAKQWVAGAGSGAPTGPAGGDLGGTYPNPTVLSLVHVTSGTTNALDVISSTRGALLERGAASWGAIIPGTSGFVLVSNGPGADPTYQTPPSSPTTSPWATVLGNGATSSGHNPQITTGDLLRFGGATASFTALKPSGTTLAVRLGDDSADGALTAGNGTFSGNVAITGKLTVTGAIDPPSVSLSSGTALFFDSADGSTAPLSAANHGRIRYLDGTGWQVSANGAAYATLSTGGASTLSSVLTAGNTTGINQIIVSSSSSGVTTSAGSGAAGVALNLLTGPGASGFGGGPLTLNPGAAAGANIAGSDVFVKVGQGTGNAAGGSVRFSVSPPGIAGSNPNSYDADTVKIDAGGLTVSSGVSGNTKGAINLSDAAGTAGVYFDSVDGAAAGNAPANHGRIRYANGTGWQFSSNAGGYTVTLDSGGGVNLSGDIRTDRAAGFQFQTLAGVSQLVGVGTLMVGATFSHTPPTGGILTDAGYGFHSAGVDTTSKALLAYQGSAGVIGLLNPASLTSSAELRVYNTTDAANLAPTNSEYLGLNVASNVFQIGTTKTGTGTVRTLALQTGGTSALTIDLNQTIKTAASGTLAQAFTTGGLILPFCATGAPSGAATNGNIVIGGDNHLWVRLNSAWSQLDAQPGATPTLGAVVNVSNVVNGTAASAQLTWTTGGSWSRGSGATIVAPSDKTFFVSGGSAAASAGRLVSINGGDGQGTNQNSGGMTLDTGLPTGTGTGDFLIKSGFALASGTTAQTAYDRVRITSNTKASSAPGTSGTVINYCNISNAVSNSGVGCSVDFIIEVADGSNHWSTLAGTQDVAASNRNGTVTANSSAFTVLGVVSDTTTFTGLTTTTTATVSGTNVLLNVTPTWAAGTPTVVRVTYQVRANGQTSITPQ